MAAPQARRVLERAEAAGTPSMERLVASEGFSEVLARGVQSMTVANRTKSNGLDFILRNLRIAGRADTARLGRQLGRTEDKLERVLQQVYVLQQSRPPAPTAPEVPDSRASDRAACAWRARLAGAAAASLVAAAVLLTLHTPALETPEQGVAAVTTAAALALAGAWAGLVLGCRARHGRISREGRG